jgi:hypothetical protein
VAERFKAPVLKHGRRCIDEYRDVLFELCLRGKSEYVSTLNIGAYRPVLFSLCPAFFGIFAVGSPAAIATMGDLTPGNPLGSCW